jgi:phage terminase large subunit-like protein
MSASLLPHDDVFVSAPILALQAMPRSRRNAVLALVALLISGRKEMLAIVALYLQPRLSDQAVADLCRVSLFTVKHRWTTFQAARRAINAEAPPQGLARAALRIHVPRSSEQEDGASDSYLLHDDFFVSMPILALMTMPTSQRNAVLALIDLLINSRNEKVALVAICYQPHLTDEEVAELCGVSVYTVKHRWNKFQAYRPSIEDYLESKRGQYYLPDEPPWAA